MNSDDRIAVCSRSFSKNPVLREELLSRYLNVTFNDGGEQLEGPALVRFLEGHDKAITALETVSEEVLRQLPQLKVISKYGVGLDMIDREALRKYGKCLGWTPGVNRRSVSELVIAFAIALLRHIPAANREILSGTWRQSVGRQLTGKTVGIIGCGHIGKDLVPLLKAFDCEILAHDILDFSEFYRGHSVKPVSLEDLLERADIVTLHVPLDESTRNIMSAARLAMMNASAVLINCARGGLVDEKELKEMLSSGKLAGAGFDVLAQEPPDDLEMLKLPNFLITPHIGGSSYEAVLAMGRAAIDGLDDHSTP